MQKYLTQIILAIKLKNNSNPFVAKLQLSTGVSMEATRHTQGT
jgi:hypothetical protein